MIRKFSPQDLNRVMRLWLQSNIEAHKFVSEEYWRSNYEMVQEQLPQAEVYVYEADGMLRGFIGVSDGYIAGIFVDGKYRSAGIGKQLLDYVKEKYNVLSLHVYEKNEGAVKFYLREGFIISSEETEESTKETEYEMTWERKELDCE